MGASAPAAGGHSLGGEERTEGPEGQYLLRPCSLYKLLNALRKDQSGQIRYKLSNSVYDKVMMVPDFELNQVKQWFGVLL